MKKQFALIAFLAIASFVACTKTEEEITNVTPTPTPAPVPTPAPTPTPTPTPTPIDSTTNIKIMPTAIGSSWKLEVDFYNSNSTFSHKQFDTITVIGTKIFNNIEYAEYRYHVIDNYQDTGYFRNTNNSSVEEYLDGKPFISSFIPKNNDTTIDSRHYTTNNNSIVFQKLKGFKATTVINNLTCYKNILYQISNSDTISISIRYLKPGIGRVLDSVYFYDYVKQKHYFNYVCKYTKIR